MPDEEQIYIKRPKGGKGAGLTQRTKDIQKYGYSLEALDEAIRGFNQPNQPALQGPVAVPTPTDIPLPVSYGGLLPRQLQSIRQPTSIEESGQPGYVGPRNIGPELPAVTPKAPSGKLPGDEIQPGRAFSDTEFEGLYNLSIGAAQRGLPFPSGGLRYMPERYKLPDGTWAETGRQVLSPESEQLYSAWKDAVADRKNQEETQRLARESQQTFLSQLLQNPSALAAFALMGGGGFGRGGVSLGQGQLPQDPYDTAKTFGFQPYQAPTATTSGYQSGDTGTALTPEQHALVRSTSNYGDLEQSGAIQRSTLPTGTPVGGFFSGGVPNLGALGMNPQAAQALQGMLALFGIDPSQLQQASAMATPGSVSGAGRARIALPGGRGR